MRAVFLSIVILLSGAVAQAATHALVVVGLAGDDDQRRMLDEEAQGWEKLLASIGLRGDALCTIRTAEGGEIPKESTRETVLKHLAGWREQFTDADDVILVLIGYGTVRNGEYQFQVRGPRLKGAELADGLAGKMHSATTFVTGPGGAALARALAGPRRITISATAGDGEIYQTQFGRLFVEAAAADAEAPLLGLLRQADEKVAAFYKDQQIIRTEHAQLTIEQGKPLEYPFNVELPRTLAQRWTLQKLGAMLAGAAATRPADQ